MMFTFSYSISLGRSSVDLNVNKLMSISHQFSVTLYKKFHNSVGQVFTIVFVIVDPQHPENFVLDIENSTGL